ncbi:hypothetical protein Airi01_100970 [Actinoallomurus iriomotensis]|uniref:Uncharacterized protein n=2 Tax=Actinoallomurus iriomotensis TaxID=478107 RepID=A0A9W6VVI5_9ACTN|nr:hypothetical protein Airi01_100970 [Actinoallomurus iriomotensis]
MPFTLQPFARSLPEAGELSASLNVGNRRVQQLDPWGKAVPRRTTLVVFADDVPISEYVIWNRPSYRASKKVMELSCSELRSVLDQHRILRPTAGYGSRKLLEFTEADAFDVFRAILQDAQDVTWMGYPVGDLSIEMDPTVMSGQLIDRRDTETDAGGYHGYEFPFYGQLLDDLATSVGFEWRIDTWLDGTRIRRRLVLGYPHVGRPADDDSLSLEYPAGPKPGPTSIIDYAWPEDGESSANYAAAIGQGEEEAMVWGEAYAADELVAGYPLLETIVSYKNDATPAIAAQHAAAEIERRRGDIVVPEFIVHGIPNCAPGDYIRARISDEARFPGSSINPMEVNARVITMTITPAPVVKTTLSIENPRGTT